MLKEEDMIPCMPCEEEMFSMLDVELTEEEKQLLSQGDAELLELETGDIGLPLGMETGPMFLGSELSGSDPILFEDESLILDPEVMLDPAELSLLKDQENLILDDNESIQVKGDDVTITIKISRK